MTLMTSLEWSIFELKSSKKFFPGRSVSITTTTLEPTYPWDYDLDNDIDDLDDYNDDYEDDDDSHEDNDVSGGDVDD